ncbi:Cytochrome P450 85A1 [Linum grandiflorum]
MAVFGLAYDLILAFISCIFVVLKWNDFRYKRKGLPPGTLGFPFVGETTEFLRLGPEFMKTQKSRYGEVFKTHILGAPTIISMDPELNRYILYNESKGFVPGYPKAMVDILGTNISSVHGAAHKHIRGSILSLIGPVPVREKLFPSILKNVRLFVSDWDGKTVDIQDKTKEMVFFLAFKQIFETESQSIYESFKPEFERIVAGTLALPINIPGTDYHTGLQARNKVIKLSKEVIKERRSTTSSTTYNDLLGQMMSDESKYPLDDGEIIAQVITILNSGYETVSKISMMSLKYLHQHPIALQELRDEHFAIKEKLKDGEDLTWDDYKSMNFTLAVILESLRLATVVNGVLRKTTNDMEVNGYKVPKGWSVYVYTREINYDPLLYPEPMKFNPWRWMDKKLESHKYNFMFGAGGRLCPGKELGIVVVSLFLHCFVTQYRWDEVGGEKLMQFPRIEAPNGMHLRISKY